jgi:hypothetical protein
MAGMVKNVCVAVGVGSPEALTYLPGAVRAAREMGVWAGAAGYIPIVVDDGDVYHGDKHAVTVERLRDTFEDIFKPNYEIDHLIFFLQDTGYLVTSTINNYYLITGGGMTSNL